MNSSTTKTFRRQFTILPPEIQQLAKKSFRIEEESGMRRIAHAPQNPIDFEPGFGRFSPL